MDSAQPTQPLSRSVVLRPGISELLACGAATVAYVATLSFGFVYDDVPQILKNPAIHAWKFVPQYFRAHVWAAIYPESAGNYYRPIFLLWLRLNYWLFGTEATGWHLTSIACHVVATWLVLRIAQRVSGERMTALIAALIFAVHPAHVENVAWISGVTDPLMSCFALGSFLAFLSFRESRKPVHAALSLALFALALLSKETAVVLSAVVFAFALLFGSEASKTDDSPNRLWAAVRASALYLLLVLIYACVRLRALGVWSHATTPVGWREVVLTWPSVCWFYVWHLALPVHLSEFYPLGYVRQATARTVVLPLALIMVAAFALYFVLRDVGQKNVARFALVLIGVPLLPVLDLRSLTMGDIVHDRYLYLPSVGFAVLAALAIRELARRFPEGGLRILSVVAMAVIVFGFAGLTLAEQMQWSNDIALYTRGIESAPDNLTVRDNLANAWLAANQPERAVPLYLEVLRRNPAFWRSNYNLGFAYYKTANYSSAEDYLRRAIEIDPHDSDQYIYLALVQLQLKKLAEAADNANRAVARNPQARGYHYVLGLIFEAADDRERAAFAFRAEVAQHPENTVAAAELQKLEGTEVPPKP